MARTPRGLQTQSRNASRRRKRLQQRRRVREFTIEQLERRTMLTDPYAAFNLVNHTDYYLVFNDGTAQGSRLQPDAGEVLAPGQNSPYSIFDTYSIDVRSDSSDGPLIGTALVSTEPNPSGYNPADSTGLLTFTYDADYSANGAYGPSPPNYAPWWTNGFLVTLDVTTWGWNNDSPYDLEITSVTGTGASPAAGTVIPAGTSMAGFIGTDFEFDILVASGSDVLGHSSVSVLNNGTDDYLSDASNFAVFQYNSDDSAASGYTVNWQDLTIDLAPPVISNDGWTSGMGNTSATATPGQSFWALDYGSEDGRWTIEDGAAYQSNMSVDYGSGTNYGSRAYPVSLDANYQPSYGPGSGFDGLWQMDIKIGSDGSSNNSFCETFYLAERKSPDVGSAYYSDGSPAGGDAGWSREIDIMETRWNGGGKVGPQINLPTGNGTGWTTDDTYMDRVLGEWSDIGGAPMEQFATFGILIRGDSLWMYAYKPDGSPWYSTGEIVKQSDYEQQYPFVPYIGTWGDPSVLGSDTIDTLFKTGYKNFIYLSANDPLIADANPLDNPSTFGQSLISATESGLFAFSGISTVAESLRLAEDALPQVPGTDVSLGQMLPVRLSDILGLDVEGNGQTTWNGFDAAYPFPTVANVQSVATAIASGTAWPAEVLPSTAGISTSAGYALQSSTDRALFAELPDLGLGAFDGFTVQAWFTSSDLSQGPQTIIDFGESDGVGNENISLALSDTGVLTLGIGGSEFLSTATVASGRWHHVSAVVTGTEAAIYLDGVRTDTFSGVTKPANLPRSSNLWGRSNIADAPAWQGQLDELRIWSRALGDEEITGNYKLSLQGSPTGLLAYYKADDTSGTTLTDSTDNGNDATRMMIGNTGNPVTSQGVFSSSLTSLVAQNGVVVTWRPSQTYHAVLSTGSLDEVLKLRRGPSATVPVDASGTLQLTLALGSAGNLLAGLTADWSASSDEADFAIDAGLGYLDTRIEGASYSLSASASAYLKAPGSAATSPGGTTATSTTVAPISYTQPSTNYLPSSGSISVGATLPFLGNVGGEPLPSGTLAPTVTLPQSTRTWASTSSYAQPPWTLQNMGDYLSLAQLDVPSLVATGLQNTGGSLAGLNRSSWLTVPFSSDVVAYDWGSGLDSTAALLSESVLSIAAFSRVSGWIPENNYGATFVITRGEVATSIELLGNLTTDLTGVIESESLVAAPIAYHFTQQLAGSGLACREVPRRPGYLEFYATDASITGFSMEPLNPTSGDYPIGSRQANALAMLGFFATPITSLQLNNGSFEGPYAGTGGTPYTIRPTGGQWVFNGTSGLALNGTEWFSPSAPAGQQAAFLQDTSSITQTLDGLDAGTYQLSFEAVQKEGVAANGINILIDGTSIFTLSGDSLLTAAWRQFTTPTFALTAGTHTLTIEGIGDPDTTTASAVDAVTLYSNLIAETTTIPTFSTLSELLDVLNQPTVIGSNSAPSALPDNDTFSGQVAIDAGNEYSAATIPAVLQFVANVPGGSVTPLVFAVSGSGETLTYSIASVGQSIDIDRSGLQTWPLILPEFVADESTTYVLGFADRSMTVAAGTVASFPGSIGGDFSSGDGDWLATAGSVDANSDLQTFSQQYSDLVSGRRYAFSAFTGLSQAGSGAVPRSETDTQALGTYAFAGTAYSTTAVPSAVRFYAGATGTITPVLLENVGDSAYAVAAIGNAITASTIGFNEHPVVFPTLGNLKPGASYLFGYQDAGTGVVAMRSTATAGGKWLVANTDAVVSTGLTTSFATTGVHSLDIIASLASGDAAADANAAVFDTTSGGVMIDGGTTFTGRLLPTAMQVQAELPAGVGSAFVTPLLFAFNGNPSNPQYTLLGAATSQEIVRDGVAHLPVDFAPTLLASLSPTGIFAVGYSTVSVQIETDGAITPTAAFPSVVGRAASVTGGNWLASDSLGTSLSIGNVFRGAATGSQIPVVAGRTFACTFLTNATQANSPSGLASLQYAGDLVIDVSYADISTSSGFVEIGAEAISDLSVPGVSDLALSGSEDVETTIAATRQFTLSLDASVMTNGVTLSNQQQQASAAPVTTSVLTEVRVSAGSQRFGIDGYVSDVIHVAAGTQVYTTPPTVSIIDATGSGSGATATANLDPDSGRLQSITLVSPGSNYEQPTFTISGGNAPATVSARWASGVVTGGLVVDGGAFYAAPPVVTITDENGPGVGAAATAIISGGVVTGITITSGGSGYVRPRITIAPPTVITGSALDLVPVPVATIIDATGVGATATVLIDDTGKITGIAVGDYQATATATLSNGVVSAIAITAGGATYSQLTPPSVIITDASGTGTGAVATATVSADGTISAITLESGGSSYTTPVVTIGPPSTLNSGYTSPTITFSISDLPEFNAPATATATVEGGALTAITVTNGSQFYGSAAPTVTISGGGGTGATATATVINGMVTAIEINNAGVGYTSAPTISVAPPITAVASVTDGVQAAVITSPGVLYQVTPSVTIVDSVGFGDGATAYAIVEAGRVVDIVFTSFGSNYVSPIVQIDAPWVDISAAPQGPSELNHTFYFLDGATWSTTTSSESGISLQYQLIDQLTELADAAATGLTTSTGSTAANAYTLQAYLAPLLTVDSPTQAHAENLAIVMPTGSNAPLVWYLSSRSNDSLVGQALFPASSWSVATVGSVSLGNISLSMELVGASGDPGFTGSAQVGYVDVGLTADSFSPEILFTLQTTPGTFESFGSWQSILTSDQLLAQTATTTAVIEAYDLSFDVDVSDEVDELVGSLFLGTPQVTLSATNSADGTFQATLTNANWGGAQSLLSLDAATLAGDFEQVAAGLTATNTAGLLASPLPFVPENFQELAGFSDFFTDEIEAALITNVPGDLDALINWARGSGVFRPAYGAASAGGMSGYALTLHPLSWSFSTSATTQLALDFGAYASLAGGLPSGQTLLERIAIPPKNTADLMVSFTASWQAPFGTILASSGSGVDLSYATSGYISGSAQTKAWVISDASIDGTNLDFAGTLATMPIVFDASTSQPAEVSLINGAITTGLAEATLAAGLAAASLTSQVAGGEYTAFLPVYYPTSTCFAGEFAIGGTGGGAAPLSGFLEPGVNPSVLIDLPNITNDAIAALSLADAVGNTDVAHANLDSLAAVLTSTFEASMKKTTQVVVGDGTKEFAAAYSIYNTIGDHLVATLPQFVPQCDQNATASATTTAGVITQINVISSGQSYTAAPQIVITDLTGTGSGATAIAVMEDDGNNGLKVASITVTAGGTGYGEPLVSVSTPTVGQETADEQLFNEASTSYNVILTTPGLVLDGSMVLTTGTYISSLTNEPTSGSLPVFRDANGQVLTYNDSAKYFVDGEGDRGFVQSVEFPLVIDYALSSTEIPFQLGMPGIPITFTDPTALKMLANGTATVDLTFGINALDGYFITPGVGNQFSGTLHAGPADNFTNEVTVGILTGSLSANEGDIFSMGFATTLTDPNGDGQVTLREFNNTPASSLFQTSLANPLMDLEMEVEMKVAGGGVAAALPTFGNTMSLSWGVGESHPSLSYENFYIDLGSFISDYMAPIATRLGPITSGVQPFLNALDTQIPILSDVIGGDTSLLGLASRYGGANVGFVQSVSAIARLVQDITSAVDYINRNPGENYRVPLAAEVTFANDFRNAATAASKPTMAQKSLPSQSQTVSAMNAYLGQYQGSNSNSFTNASKKILNVNSSYGVSGGLGISFDILSAEALIDLMTGQTTNLFTITFPELAANFSIDSRFAIFPPLFMTFGGGVNASAKLGMGMTTAGLEVFVDALQSAISANFDGVDSVADAASSTTSAAVSFTDFLSPAALSALAVDVIEDGLFIDSSATRINAGGYLSIGAELNAGAARGGAEGRFNIGMTMTPNGGSDGRLTLGEMTQLAGDNFSSPLNLFNFNFQGSISADAYLKVLTPFKWRKIWSHDFGSFTIFDINNNPKPPTQSAASVGSLFLNMGPTAARRGDATAGVSDEHFEIRHLGGTAGNETVSVQFYVDGVAQYVDSDGNPEPQVYTGVTNIVALGGHGNDVIDCTGILSPVEADGGDGEDTILGGLGVNTLLGGRGKDSLFGAGVKDYLSGGDGEDFISIASKVARVAAGLAEDVFLRASDDGGDYTFIFDDHFGGDLFASGLLDGATLDFSRMTKPVSLLLGANNSVSMGGKNAISWTGAGPRKIILGAGHDNVSFADGYAPLDLDLGGGRNQIEIRSFVANAAVKFLGLDPEGDDQLTILESAARSLGLSATGVTADNGAAFLIDSAHLRKLSVRDADADVALNFDGATIEKIDISAKTVALLSALRGKHFRFIGADGVSIDGDLIASRSGNVLLQVLSSNAAVTIGEAAAAAISTVFGNIAIKGDRLAIGSQATSPFSILGGAIENNAASTTVPQGRALIGSLLLGPGGDYTGAHLPCHDVTGVDLSGANLTDVNFSEADLSGANLSDANLSGTNLSGTKLKGAKLKSSSLRGANLEGADLSGARLSGTTVDGVLGNPFALPAGWKSQSGAIVFVGVDVPLGQTQFLNVVHSGNEEIVKTGDGTLVLAKANSHVGGTYVESGTLYVRHVNALGSGPLIVRSGASVVLDVGFSTVAISSLSLEEGATLKQITPSGYTSSEAAFTLTSDGRWIRLFNDGSQLTSTTFATWASRVDWQFPVIGDFNGDGMPDVAAMTPGGVWWAAINQGDGTSLSIRMTQWSRTAGWRDVLTGDFNGDGRTDITGRTAGGGWWVAFARQEFPGFVSSLAAQWSNNTTWSDVVAGDFNGDGRTDIAGRNTTGVWWASLMNGSGLAVNTRMGRWNGGTYADVATGDVNGDGQTDIIGRASDGSWWAAIASGSTPGFTSQLMTRWSSTAGWQDVRFGDLDGNGRTDLLGRSSNGQWWAAYARDTSVGFDSVPLGVWNSSIDWKNVILGDFDFDGRLDLAGVATANASAQSGRWWAGLLTNSGLHNSVWGQFGLEGTTSVRSTFTTSTR